MVLFFIMFTNFTFEVKRIPKGKNIKNKEINISIKRFS